MFQLWRSRSFFLEVPIKNLGNENVGPTKTGRRQNWKPDKGRIFKKKNNFYCKEDNESSSGEDKRDSEDEEEAHFTKGLQQGT